jgi:phage baseplate assembly protein V
MKKLVMDCVRQALAGVRQAYRARLTSRSDGAGVQLVQGEALADEVLQAGELFQQFGFTSAPPAGTQLIVLPLGGRTAHSVVIATENGAYRVDVSGGEACIYNMWGDKVHLKQERIEVETKTFQVTATEQVLFKTPAFNMVGPDGGTTAASVGGSLHASGDMTAGAVSLRGHVHPENDNGGPTGAPVGG